MSIPTQTCPECRTGKHANCTGWALDARDQEVDCPCECGRNVSGILTGSGGAA